VSDPLLIAYGLIGNRDLTDEVLDEVVATLKVLPQTKDANIEAVRKQLESTVGISMARGEGLTDGENLPWVEDIKASTNWTYWDSYTQQLRSDNFALNVIRTLDEDTDNILTECGNPKNENGWRIQGLVMGDVQSGKTASYCGLISKAADAGYRVIVLLTGTIEDLRSQSQERLDEGFVGADSIELLSGNTSGRRFGAGRFRNKTPNVLTSIDSDFLTGNRKALRGIPLENINEPVLLVMKKNKTALENLIKYLKSQMPNGVDSLRLPLLLVDDEADNASVNAKKDEDPATINRLIRELISKFQKASYVAYTATPFANVFINPEGQDLFPKNFVYSLNAPTSYIGAASIFLAGGHENQLEEIDDAESIFPEKHKKDLEVQELPESLKDAIGVFLLSCAIRDIRREPLKHRSMLINVSRFTDVQRALSDVTKTYLYELVETIKQYLAADDLWHRHALLNRLHKLYVEHYDECGSSWDDVRAMLYESTASVKVLTINQKTGQDERLNYRAYKANEKGRRVIAIGGQTLSRGLTLEGLCVSYFYRNSKAYDTLLQMGRWFGYRPRYSDLCRVWMSSDASSWFRHIAGVVVELRNDIKRMHANKLKPSQFGIRVKSHPGALLVTATNKMRNSSEVEIDLSFSLRQTETAILPKSPETNEANAFATSNFLKSLGKAGRPRNVGKSTSDEDGGRMMWRRIPASRIADFLEQLQISPLNAAFLPDQRTGELPLIGFIRNSKLDKLSEWDVCLPQGKGDKAREINLVGPDGTVLSPQKRMRRFEKPTNSSASYLKVNKQRVGEIADEKVDLYPEQIKEVELNWLSGAQDRDGKTVPGSAYRALRERPLLTVHLIQPSAAGAGKAKEKILDPSAIEPKLLIAVSLHFPTFEETEATAVPYRLNKVYLQQLGLIDDEGEDDDDDQD
jgi:hypothetical protein